MKTYRIIKTILYLTLGILNIIFYKQLGEYVAYLVGGVMITYGLEFVIEALVAKKKPWERHHFLEALIEILLGLYVIIFINDQFVEGDAEDAFRVICVIWGVWSILREGREIEEVIERFKERLWIPFILNLAESVAIIILSSLLILDPEHAALHIILMGVELILFVAFPLLDLGWAKMFHKKHEEEVK